MILPVNKNILNITLLFLIVFLIPSNLGYHFIMRGSYVQGLLNDYLIPTLYFQDVLLSIFLLLNLKTLFSKIASLDKYLIWFLFVIVLASLGSVHTIVSLSYVLRTILYVLFAHVATTLFSKEEIIRMFVRTFSLAVFLLSVLAFFQWKNQSSVFNNYLAFGEQPYSISTAGINTENFFGVTKIPPYATFRHPNTFAGFLSIVLIWLLYYSKEDRFYKTSFAVGVVALFLTLSKFSYISLILSIAFLYLHKKRLFKGRNLIILVFCSLSLGAFFLPQLTDAGVSITKVFSESPSIYRRADLLESSYKLLSKVPLFGLGGGTSAMYIEKLYPITHDIRFTQPVHNIFVPSQISCSG